MSRRPHRGILLVEGKEDKWVIPQFMENFIPWGEKDRRDQWPADIIENEGIDPIVKPGFIEAELKSPGLEALGIIVDANSDPAARWEKIRERAKGAMPTIPDTLPAEGLICENTDGLRFGVWLMPDNVSRGMLETFLASCIPESTKGLWTFVKAHCEEAKAKHGATYKEVHLDKACIHAWLALQDPPGQQLHSAIIQKTLRPESPYAVPFVNWFRKLFRV